MKKVKSKMAKATVIPALCAVATVFPMQAKANWAAGIGYLFSGLLTGGGTAVVANATRKPAPKKIYTQPVQQPQPIEVEQPVYEVPQEVQYEIAPGVLQSAPVVSPNHPAVQTQYQPQPVRRVIRRRIIRTTTQDGTQQPIIEEIIEEIPVPQQPAPRYNQSTGYQY